MSDLGAAIAELPAEQRLALSYSRTRERERFAALFTLDRQLGQALARGREPLAAQLRLAWWRDLLGGKGGPASDPATALVLKHWHSDSASAIAMVDGWEQLVSETPDLAAFADGRAAPFVSFAQERGCGVEPIAQVGVAARRWALVDLAEHLSVSMDRDAALTEARSLPPVSLPRAMRPLAVLDGLARRSLAQGVPMLGDRLSPFVALRLGIFGR